MNIYRNNFCSSFYRRGYDFLGKIITGIGKAMITTAQTRKVLLIFLIINYYIIFLIINYNNYSFIYIYIYFARFT